MGLLVGIGKPAGNLVDLHILRVRGKGERHHPFIALLLLHFGKINTSSVDSGRRSRLEPEHFHTVFLQGIRQVGGRLQAVGSGFIAHIAINAAGLQVRSRTENHRLTAVFGAGKGTHTPGLTILHNQLRNLCLTDGEMIRVFQNLPHGIAVISLIRLCPQGMYRRSFGPVQHL